MELRLRSLFSASELQRGACHAHGMRRLNLLIPEHETGREQDFVLLAGPGGGPRSASTVIMIIVILVIIIVVVIILVIKNHRSNFCNSNNNNNHVAPSSFIRAGSPQQGGVGAIQHHSKLTRVPTPSCSTLRP